MKTRALYKFRLVANRDVMACVEGQLIFPVNRGRLLDSTAFYSILRSVLLRSRVLASRVCESVFFAS